MTGSQRIKPSYRKRPWWRRHTIKHYRVWRIAYRLGLTREPW